MSGKRGWLWLGSNLGASLLGSSRRQGTSYRSARAGSPDSGYDRRLRSEPLEDRRLLSITVDTLVDESDGSIDDGDVSLRDAIALAPPGETIDFAESLHGGTITLTLGELVIDKSLTIDGPGAELLTIDASGNDPTPDSTRDDGDDTNDGDGSWVFSVDDGDRSNNIDVEIHGLTLTGGDVDGSGGAISSRESFTPTETTVSGNSAGSGGGIATDTEDHATTTISHSTISGNSAGGGGGGINIHTGGNGITTLEQSTVSGNTSSDRGGGVHIVSSYDGTTIVNHSTISNNYAAGGTGFGGGRLYIRSSGLNGTTIIDSTISGNNTTGAGGGGAVNGNGTTSIIHSTVADNSASFGGGIAAGPHSPSDRITISDSTISHNSAENRGGGIFASGTTIIANTISDNSAGTNGGGIYALRMTTIIANTIVGNTAAANGGGIVTRVNSGTTTILSNTVSGNSAGLEGGGIYARTATTIADSTISDNSGFSGGGIRTIGPATVTGSTISCNTATDKGSGIQASGGTTIAHSTIAGNVAYGGGPGEPAGGGIWGDPTLDHTIVAGNTRSLTVRDDVYGSVMAAYSLIGDDSGAIITDNGGNLIGTAIAPIDPLLGPLQDNGGPTQTHALRLGSPAIDAGDLSFVPPPLTDQRGYYRVVDGDGDMTARIDIGAYEFASVAPIAGDGNLDGVVDGLDYLVWGANFGATAVAPVAQQRLTQHQGALQNAAHDAVLQEHDDSIVTPQLASSVTDARKSENTWRLGRAFDHVFAKLAAKRSDD